MTLTAVLIAILVVLTPIVLIAIALNQAMRRQAEFWDTFTD